MEWVLGSYDFVTFFYDFGLSLSTFAIPSLFSLYDLERIWTWERLCNILLEASTRHYFDELGRALRRTRHGCVLLPDSVLSLDISLMTFRDNEEALGTCIRFQEGYREVI